VGFNLEFNVELTMLSVLAIEPEIKAEAQHRKIDGDISPVEDGEVDRHER
jgi:hypothetical protein